MKIVFWVCIFSLSVFFLSIKGFCQNRELDSLFQVLPKATTDTGRIRILGQISEQCEFNDILKYSNQILELAEKNKSANDSKSKRTFLREKARAYNNIGYYYYTGSKAIDALENYQKAGIILEQDSLDYELLNSVYTNIAGIENQIGEYDKALQTLRKCLKSDLKQGSLFYIGTDYNNVSALFGSMNKPDSAILYGLKAISIRESELKEKPEVFNSLITYHTNLGSIYLTRNDIGNAGKHINEAYQLALKNKDTSSYSIVNYWQSRILLYKKQFREAKTCLQKALKFADNNKHIQSYYNVYYGLYMVSDSLKDYQNAYKYYKLFRVYADSQMNINVKKEAAVKSLKFEYETKEIATKANYDKELAVEQAKEQKQRIIIWFIIAFLILVMASGLFVLRSYLQKKRINKELETKNRLIEQQKQLVEDKQKQIVDSINYAKYIQQSVLANEEEIKSYLKDFFVLYLPKDIVSGDFYWFTKQGSDLFFATVDCTGHGVPGAFLSMVGSTLLNEIVNFKKITDPYVIIESLAEGVTNTLSNKKDKEDAFADGMDISICKVNIGARKLYFASANHVAFVVDDTGLKQLDPQVKSVHGVFALSSKKGISTTEVSLNPGTMVFMSTDGYADQVGEQTKKKLMAPKFKEVLYQAYKLPIEEQKILLEKTLLEWRGNRKQNDDILVMGFRIP
jgi:serine phosphatase RsbU (regulator of sigma subunit)